MSAVTKNERTETDTECWCGRGMVMLYLYVCARCLHDRATAFWQLMGLPGIPAGLTHHTSPPH